MSTDRDGWKPTDKRTHCSVKVQVLLCRRRQISKGIKVVTMVRRLAAQEHSAALAQLASCISAIMKFGAGADDDPFVKVKVQTVSASQKQTSCLNLTMRLDRIGAAVLISSPMAARHFTTMQRTVFGSTSGSVWTRTRFRLSYSASTLK